MMHEPPELPADRLLARKEQVMTAFHELQQEPPEPTPARPRRRRMFALAGVATAAVAATVAGLLVAQPDAKPAFALTPNGDGTSMFVINDPRDAAAATEALRAAGIHAVVMPMHAKGECPADQRGTRDGRQYPPQSLSEVMEYERQHPGSWGTVRIRPAEIPDGTVLVIGTWERDMPPIGRVLMAWPALFTAPGPACLERDVDDVQGTVSPSPTP